MIDFILIDKFFFFLINITAFLVVFWVYSSDPKGKINRLFILFTFFILLYIDLGFIASVQFFDGSYLSLLRLRFGAVSIFFIIGYKFFLLFPKGNVKPPISEKVWNFVWFGLLLVSILTPLMIKEIKPADWGTDVVFGEAMLIYYVITSITIVVLLYILFKKYLTSIKEDKIKIQYYVFGILFAAIFNLIFNIILPIIYGSMKYHQVGDYSWIPFIILVAISIVKSNLFGIKMILVYALVSVISILLLLDIIVFPNELFVRVLKISTLLTFVYFGRSLIRSVLKEIKLKEQLQDLNLHLQDKVDEQTKEIKVAYEVEKTARLKLEDLNKVKDEFITTAAHQLRTPLSATRWALKSLLDGTLGKIPFNDTQKDLLEKTYTSNNNLINIVGDLLDTSSIDSKAVLYNFQEQDISLLLKEVVSASIFQLKDKKIKINYHEPEDYKIFLKFDQDKLSMAFQNIVSNAIDYTPDGGSIDVTLKKEENQVIIEIKDTGIGIPEEAQAHIFEKFYRGDNAKKTETDRSGLGLYISKQIIERHGGTITVESEVGKGTRMVVSIPS